MTGLRVMVLGLGLLLLAGCSQSPAPVATPTANLVATPSAIPAVVASPSAAGQASPVPAASATAPQPVMPALRPGVGTPSLPALFLEVAAPAEEIIEVPSGRREIAVAGRTAPGAVVSVNGLLAEVDEAGLFQLSLPLDDEVVSIEIVASDGTGREVRAERIVVQE